MKCGTSIAETTGTEIGLSCYDITVAHRPYFIRLDWLLVPEREDRDWFLWRGKAALVVDGDADTRLG